MKQSKKKQEELMTPILVKSKPIGIDYVETKKGVVGKDKFYLPKNSVERFDGSKVYFKITEEEAEKYKKD
jgi:hypothetical protein